ncbi:HEPN domain-containing protein [Oribacterium sp. WCC10]|uniref:HEPN domain-containing protein n=1 Tax=Oribacterium sp. WCC10 TaxID=1855343 RepID=UPI0008E6F2BC|nr:HEPN domain-containing protein [Oribacterium sp. WCC10]SFG25571.1 Uncharacterized protein, contains HEPN domain, UPF0332 family [Oribacterium sp. WCC10]
MDGSLNDLAFYRLEKAKEDLVRSKRELEISDYKLTLNRSYYAIFHAIRAANTLDGFDSSKHSGVIAHFNQFHVKTEDFPSDISKKIANAMNIRQLSYYDDFYIASKKVAEEQVRVAEKILGLVEQ